MATTKSNNETLPDQLRGFIAKSGLSTYKLAKLSGVDHRVLGRFRRSENGITLDTADRVAAVLDLTLSEKAKRPDPKPKAPRPRPFPIGTKLEEPPCPAA